MKKLLACIALIASFALLTLSSAAEAPEGERSGVLSVEGFRNAGFDVGEVRELRFSDTLESMPRGAWDVSSAGDGSVRAWLEARTLTIAADSRVKAPADCSGLFEGFTGLEIVTFSRCFDTSACVNMRAMFKDCPELWYLYMDGIDTSNVTDMSEMFAGCTRAAPYLHEFDTRNVVTFEGMFRGCENFLLANFIGFDTSSATNMREMFAGCSILRNVSNFHFDTSKVETMERMFQGCRILPELDMSDATFAEGMALDSMFEGCEKLERLYVGDGFGALDDATLARMLADCPAQIVAIGSEGMEPGVLRSMDGVKGDVLGVAYPRDAVRSVRFSDDPASAPVDAWDVSARGDGSVLAWFADGAQGTELVIAAEGGVRANPNSAQLFMGYSALEEIHFDGCFDTSLCTTMREMFDGCHLLKTLDLSSFNTSRLEDMEDMLRSCASLRTLDLTPLDTSHVTDMRSMFYACEGLEAVDMSTLDTSSLTNTYWMFGCCYSLKELDLSSFDTSHVDDMHAMFEDCTSLTRVDLSSFDTSRVDDMNEMFCYCSSLEELDLTSFDTALVENWTYMFYDCERLHTIRVGEGFVIPEDAWTDSMFTGCDVEIVGPDDASVRAGLHHNTLMRDVPPDEDIEGASGAVFETWLPRWLVRSITFLDDTEAAPNDAWEASDAGQGDVIAWAEENGNMYDLYIASDGGVWANPDSSYLFHGYLFLEEINFNGCFHTEQATDMTGMFGWCASLKELDLSGFDTSRVESMASMFLSCVSLAKLDLSGFDTAQVNDMSYMFSACANLPELDVTGFDTSRVKNMEGMFAATDLKKLDLRGFDTAQVESMDMMFFNCDALEEIQTSESFVIGENTGTEEMLSQCSAAESVAFQDAIG